jgi:fatty-acyl-CoA synthase
VSGIFRGSANAFHGVRVLARAGIVKPLEIGQSLASMSDVRHWGPLAGAIRIAARHDPSSVGLVDERGSVTFKELDMRSNALANAMRERGVTPDMTIGVLCRDHGWLVESLAACGKIGADVVLLNTGFAAPQLVDVVQRESISVLIHDEEFTSVTDELPYDLPRILAWAETPMGIRSGPPRLAELVADGSTKTPPRPEESGTVVLLTSGTTGAPKGARRRVRSALSAADFLDRVPMEPGGCTFVAAPLFHGIGYAQLILAMGLRSTVVMHRRFDASEVVRAVREHGCTGLVLVPTMLQRILDLDENVVARFMSSLQIILLSGSQLPTNLCQRALDLFGDIVYNLYGSTEVAVATVATPSELRKAPRTVGRSPHTCLVRLYDEEGRSITRPDTVGRIFVGSDLGFTGYTGSGHKDRIGDLISTGDLGHFDENGLLFVDGREDDMIVSGGENVFPSEVEDLLARHYQVKDVAVVGVDDDEFGQRLRAYVVPVPGAGISPEHLKNFVRVSLARHKVPREIVFVRAVPRNATGKILRYALVG